MNEINNLHYNQFSMRNISDIHNAAAAQNHIESFLKSAKDYSQILNDQGPNSPFQGGEISLQEIKMHTNGRMTDFGMQHINDLYQSIHASEEVRREIER